MRKLINGRPMNELNFDDRQILTVNIHGAVMIVNAWEGLKLSLYSEWAEILKPEPKPDAHGWWKLTEKEPEEDQLIQLFMHLAHKTVVRYWRVNLKREDSYTHWKSWEGPVE